LAVISWYVDGRINLIIFLIGSVMDVPGQYTIYPMRLFFMRLPEMYRNNPHTIGELKQEMSAAVLSVIEKSPAAVLRNFRRRIQMAMEADDAHIENMFT
jgi:hypothetical protein